MKKYVSQIFIVLFNTQRKREKIDKNINMIIFITYMIRREIEKKYILKEYLK